MRISKNFSMIDYDQNNGDIIKPIYVFNIQKFKSRSHKFILFELIHIGIILYIGLILLY